MFKHSIKQEHLASNLLGGLGLGLGIGEVHYLFSSTSAAPYLKLCDDGVDDTYLHSTLATAESALTTLRNDVILVSPESHSLASSLTWDLNEAHLIGLAPETRVNHRARIGMSTTFTPMITVSGYGNSFRNLYTMHGTAAGDYVGWAITGNRNSFHNIHFGGPMIAAQGGHASYEGVTLTATECFFKDCTFGVATIGRDELTPNLTITVPATGYAHNIFQNCTFLLFADDTDPYFVKLANTSGVLLTEFLGCRFICVSSNMAVAAAVAFTVTSGSTCCTIIDPNCEFINCTKAAASASMKYLWEPTVFAATTDELNLIALNSATY